MDKRGLDSTTIKILAWAMNTICITVIFFCFLIIILPSASAGYYFYDMLKDSTLAESPWIIIPEVFTVLVLLVTLFLLFRNFKIQKILKAQQDKNILNMPLEQYGADTAAKAEIPVQNNGSVSKGFTEVQEAYIKRLMDDNAAEIAKYISLARRALQAGKENEAWIFVEKKQNLEISRVAINATYANIVNMRRARVFTPKDEAEALAEKYAAQDRLASVGKNKNTIRSKASVDEELAKIKTDMGL